MTKAWLEFCELVVTPCPPPLDACGSTVRHACSAQFEAQLATTVTGVSRSASLARMSSW